MAPRPKGSFPCEDCDKVFSRKEYVDRHRRLTHLGHRPFSCDACGNGFARSDLLKRHLGTCATIKQQKAEQSAYNAHSHSPPEASTSASAANHANPNAIPIPREGIQSTHLNKAGVSGPYYDQSALPAAVNTSPQDVVSSLAATFGSYGSTSSASTSPSLFSSSGSDASPLTGDSSVGNSPESQFGKQEYSPPNLSNLSMAGQSASSLTSDAARLMAPGIDGTTLAPPLDKSNPWCGFSRPKTPQSDLTAGEIEASEVLEKLLRSPRMSPALTGPTDFNATVGQSYFPDGQALIPGYSSGDLMVNPFSGSLWEDDTTANLEFGQEAAALAEYFNQGGVGGITALDLGFPYQPTLFPDHMFEPRIINDARLHIPNEKFCAGFLYPWKDQMPEVGDMERFAITATEKILPRVPIMHEPTMRFTEMSTHSVFALSVAGGAYDVGKKGEQFSGTMLSLKRVYIIKSFNRPENTDDDRFQHLQSMLLYQLVSFYRDEQHRQMSHTFHGGLCQMFRQLDLVSMVRKAKIPTCQGVDGDELEQQWREWVKIETWRRVAFIVYLIDLETSSHFKTNPVLSFSELDIDLPSSELLWKAKSAVEFQKIRASPVLQPNTHFLKAIRALMASGSCSPFSEDGLVLSELSGLDPLPLLILSRSLSFLQLKTEEAIAQSDPFRSMLGGITGKQEGEEQEVLRRIKAGRAHLRKMPGGIQRGGGESWFTEVMPQATPPEAAQQPPQDSVLTPAVMRAVQLDTEALASQYPDFVKLANGGAPSAVPLPMGNLYPRYS